MSEAMIEALRAMQADLKQVEIISQNVANQSTPGYRAMQPTDPSFDLMTNANAGSRADVQTTVSAAGGAISPTGNSMDVAVTNGAFLEVENPRSQVWSETAVVGGKPIVSNLDGGQRTIFVRTVMVDEAATVQQFGNGVYAVADDQSLSDTSSSQVLQGYLEQSNVNSSESMVRMMEVSKHLESVQRTLRTLDDMLGSSINEIDR